MVRWAFDVLGIEVTKDKRKIKKAYAVLTKQYHPEENPAEWEKLYSAYQAALEYAQMPEVQQEVLEHVQMSEEQQEVLEHAQMPEEQQTVLQHMQTEEPEVEPATEEAVSSNAVYDELFQEAQKQWVQEKTIHEQLIRRKLKELVNLRGKKALKEWRQFFTEDFPVAEGEETLLLLLEKIQENELSEKVVQFILQTMNQRLKVYTETGDACRGIVAAEIVKYCAKQVPLLHRKNERKKKMIGIPAALAAGFLILAMTGLHEEQIRESDVLKIAVEYLNEKYGDSAYNAMNLEAEKVRIFGNNEDKIDSYAVRELESGDVIAYAMRDAEDKESAFVCFDNIQESDIRAAFEEKMNTLTDHVEGRLFWDSSIGDSMSGGLEDGFFQAKYEGDFDDFIQNETEMRSEAPGVSMAFFMSDYHSVNGICDYYLPDPVVQTMSERLNLSDYTEDTKLQEVLNQSADDYKIQMRGVILPSALFQEKMEQAVENEYGLYVSRDVHGTLGLKPSMSFLMLTGWYVSLPVEDQKLLNIADGMYMQPMIAMGEGIYGAESSIKTQGLASEPEWLIGSIMKTENPESLGLTEAEKQKAVSFQLADGYVLKNDYCLAIDKKLYGIADEGYRVMVTKQKGVSMDVADKHLEVKDGTAIEKYVSDYGDPGAMLGQGETLDGEGYLFIEYQAAENALEADIVTVINP